MKNFTWKRWVAFGTILAVVIALVVLHLVQPAVSFALLEIFTGSAFILGGVTGYLLKKNDIVKE